MSWDQVSRTAEPCPCGSGTCVTTMEMDDWNRCRTFTEIKCRACGRQNAQAKKLIRRHQETEQKLRRSAEGWARKRYLPDFLARVSGDSKKEVWTKVFQGRKYPSLATFYAHTKAAGGLDRYLERHFLQNLNEFVPKVFRDAKIEKLLGQAQAAMAAAARVQRDYAAFLPLDD
jgi:hypothetical protein